MKVKICGIIHPDDAKHAAQVGADYIGIIFAEQSRRKVSVEAAKNIANISKDNGATPVGVFVDHHVKQIISICKQTGINTIQLHGEISRQALDDLSRAYGIIYAISVNKQGSGNQIPPMADTVISLYDNAQGGTGTPFNWNIFTPPENKCWMLAGGLNVANVAEAIALLQPNGVDVATGVEFPHITRKDPALVKAFIEAAKNIKEKK